MSKTLSIHVVERSDGIDIKVRGRSYRTRYPRSVWASTPADVRRLVLENLGFGFTHYLPLILGGEEISYNFPCPLLESILFRNQIGDMLVCEKADKTGHLDYLRDFYGLSFKFAAAEAALPETALRQRGETAVLPFSFGKESLATLGICLELGIKPVLMYSEEPVQPYEAAYKKKLLRRLSEDFGIQTYFVKNEPGLFRYGRAFGKKRGTELGWGTQTTLLCLMALPLVFAHGAKYIFLGSEYSNNEYLIKDGWKVFLSYDQTSFWTQQQRNMLRLLTGGKTSVYSSLEPIEEINIFSLLQHRYPELGRFQFSCTGEKPLVPGTQWCHKCYKCARMSLFASACGIDPASIGFKRDLLAEPGHFENYFGKEFKSGSAAELDFAFYVLHMKDIKSPYVEKFRKTKLRKLGSWNRHRDIYTNCHPALNLPPAYEKSLRRIFGEELKRFQAQLPA